MKWLAFGLFIILSIRTTDAECPRKHAATTSDDTSAQPPGFEPPEQFLQTTFIHNDHTDEEREFSIVVTEKLRELRQKLKQMAKLTVDNENLDCADHNYPKCREFPQRESYHFLIIEDANHGAVVYSIDQKQNKARSDVIENALLDALSRHSAHSLMSFASEQAERSVGFVRELSVAELEKFMADNQALRDVDEPTIFRRSPFELQLLNERILELRVIDAEKEPLEGLKVFRVGELHELIDMNEKRPVFTLFWTHVNSVSVHVYSLWRRVVERLQNDEEIRKSAIFGHVPCHEEIDLCTAFGISHQDYRTVFAYRGSRKFASQYAIGDEEFYANWVRMVLYGSPHRLQNEQELQDARRGYLQGFPTDSLPRPAVTVGVFPSEESEEFQRFLRLSRMLYGRYHFVYYVQPNADGAALSTFRPLEKTKRTDYVENFDMSSLLAHVTQSSIPFVLNISTGFTADIIYRSSKPIILLIHNADFTLLQEFNDLAATLEYKSKYFFAHIDQSYSLSMQSFLKELSLQTTDLPSLHEFQKDQIKTIGSVKGPLHDLFNDLIEGVNTKVFQLERNKAHPLKSLQLEHTNRVFGVQDIKLLPEPILVNTYTHDRQSMDMGAAGGCPMLAGFGNTGVGHGHRDEL
ncbi:hypothetical protein M3Y94_00297000 [Aphelenchoides besseyi]|nr:hypothetical protein M3Y94_00297000 [Aphelenchoides besseyi]KAI6235863.1 hypothetical protein M3Y95_00096600 [Aphelenchoides besseyi]